jgi:predicted transcriptional regulator
VQLMQALGCRHLPIVSEGKAVGLVSRGKLRSVASNGVNAD